MIPFVHFTGLLVRLSVLPILLFTKMIAGYWEYYRCANWLPIFASWLPIFANETTSSESSRWDWSPRSSRTQDTKHWNRKTATNCCCIVWPILLTIFLSFNFETFFLKQILPKLLSSNLSLSLTPWLKINRPPPPPPPPLLHLDEAAPCLFLVR